MPDTVKGLPHGKEAPSEEYCRLKVLPGSGAVKEIATLNLFRVSTNTLVVLVSTETKLLMVGCSVCVHVGAR